MPPASVMADNTTDPFGQFGQLSLDPYAPPPPQAYSQRAPGHHPPTGLAPATPPHCSESAAASATREAPAAGLDGAGLHHSQYQYPHPPQPMQISPEHPHAPSMPRQRTPPSRPPRTTPLLSPPVSPLRAPASPAPSPPGGAPPVVAANPFDAFAAAPAPTTATTVPADPFGARDALAAPATPPQAHADDADFWSSMGFAVVPPADGGGGAPAGDVSPGSDRSSDQASDDDAGCRADAPCALGADGLPVGGEYYKARVTTPMLGAIFSSGKELRSTLYKTASDAFVEAIGERPVVSFTIDGSAADTAGIGLGHVLLKVNDREVSQTDDAVRTVGAASRPMVMDFYVPNKEVRVVKTEGQCMVKYDNHSTEAPATVCEWKPKYVVVGDMLGKPYILYMYRSKAEYDIAVKESQTRNRALSVKVKQFDLRGAKIFHEHGTVSYPNKPRWHYFTVVRGQGMPIKISARAPEDLQPVYEGIVGFLDRDARTKRARLEQHRERARASGMHRETYY